MCQQPPAQWAVVPFQPLLNPTCVLQVNTWDTTYYTQTAGQLKGWWTVVGLCTGTFSGLCEIPRSYYACPPAPPPRPPPVVIPTGTCECHPAATSLVVARRIVMDGHRVAKWACGQWACGHWAPRDGCQQHPLWV